MQLATLDRETTATGDAVASLTALTGLSALTERVADEQLPCRVNDPELFFAESPDDVEYAKTLCATCPARLDCLTGALERREPWGVWGGEWFVQGRRGPAQASAWPSPQVRGRRMTARDDRPDRPHRRRGRAQPDLARPPDTHPEQEYRDASHA